MCWGTKILASARKPNPVASPHTFGIPCKVLLICGSSPPELSEPKDHVDSAQRTMFTDSSHLSTDSSHISTDSSHVSTDSSRMSTNSSHISTDSSHVSTDSSRMSTDSSRGSTDSSHIYVWFTYIYR